MKTVCPRCGQRADAIEVRLLVPPELRPAMKRHAEVVRRELGIGTEGEALAEAARRLALQLNQGS